MDLYSTHLDVLRTIFSNVKIETVLEFGTGLYSTKFFVENSKKITSIEMQDEIWLNKVNESIKNENWTPILCLGELSFKNLTYNEHYDLCFVDGVNRAECINFMENKTDIIVAHDTEIGCMWYPHVNLSSDYLKFDYRKVVPNTTVWTKNKELIEILNKL